MNKSVEFNTLRYEVRADLSLESIRKLLQKAFTLGFYSKGADFPVFCSDCPGALDAEQINLEEISKVPASVEHPDYLSASKYVSQHLEEFSNRLKELKDLFPKGLESIFEPGLILEDQDGDGLSDIVLVKFSPRHLTEPSVLAAACNLACRLGLSTTAFSGDLLASDNYQGNIIEFTNQAEARISLYGEDQGSAKSGIKIQIDGRGQKLENLVAEFCQRHSECGTAYYWRDFKTDFKRAMQMKTRDGQVAFAKSLLSKGYSDFDYYLEPDPQSNYRELEAVLPKVNLHNYKSDKLVFQKQHDFVWEVDDFREIFKLEIIPQMKENPCAHYQILAAVSEGAELRENLREEVERSLKEQGLKAEVNILCSYKQGFSWLSELISAKLSGEKVAKIDLQFKPFLPEGVSEWVTADGAIPSNQLDKNEEDTWLDIPIRFLQELYPADEVLARNLGLNKEDIKFSVYEGEENITYRLMAYNQQGEIVREEHYKTEYYERPYLYSFPRLGKVHPSSAYLKLFRDDALVFSKTFATDTDKVWQVFQREILPQSKEYILEKYQDKKIKDNYPLFKRLELNLKISEVNFRIGTREDMVSSAESLAQDFYFVAGQFFNNLGLENFASKISAPGLVLPDIEVIDGIAPKLDFVLYDQLRKGPGALFKEGGDARWQDAPVHDSQIIVRSVNLGDDGRLNYECEIKGGADEDILAAYFELFSNNHLDICAKAGFISHLSLAASNITADKEFIAKQTLDFTADKEKLKNIDLRSGEVISYEMYLELIKQFKELSCFDIYEIGRSYEGRIIYAVDLIAENSAYLSRVKEESYKPSVLVNARHHANEVSSTNAMFELMAHFVCDKKLQDAARKVKITILPLENVDGAAIHYKLMQKNPHWKLHMGRFNALGYEFFRDMFREDTPSTETYAFARVYKNVRPDLIIDNHGVPTHEWDQQYSGYTAPGFQGFWLPRSIIYGYFWPPQEEVYKSNVALCRALQDVIAEAIGSHEELRNLNLEWAERFEKYAHNWLPKLFPADYYKEMIFYWIYQASGPDKNYVSWRHPWLNSAYFTSEVIDETAQGEYLKICTKAHFVHNLELLYYMAKTRKAYLMENKISDHEISMKLIRQRPILPEALSYLE